MKKVIINLFLVFILLACENQVNSNFSSKFTQPELIEPEYPDYVKKVYHKKDYLSVSFPEFVGKYSFKKQINVNKKDNECLANIPESDKCKIKKFDHINVDDSIGVNGLEVQVDYNTTVFYNSKLENDSLIYAHFPVYIINNTASDKLFFGKENRIFGNQEAMRNNYIWYPIEGNAPEFSAKGMWAIKIHPKEFMLILMKKYKGDFNTKMRVRIKNGKSIMVSNPFIGRFNKKQFEINKESFYYGKFENKSPGYNTTFFYFNGKDPYIFYKND